MYSNIVTITEIRSYQYGVNSVNTCHILLSPFNPMEGFIRTSFVVLVSNAMTKTLYLSFYYMLPLFYFNRIYEMLLKNHIVRLIY